VPWLFAGSAQGQSRPCIENLIDQVYVGGQITPRLAESYEWSADYLALTLHLRKGVKFHDGTDFNATAVKWNLDHGKAANLNGSEVISAITVVDDYTVKITLTQYRSTWLAKLAGTGGQSYIGCMISPTSFDKLGLEVSRWNPVGTGPMKFKSFVRDTRLQYVRNDDYWGGKPYVDGVTYTFIADPVTAQMAFQAGEASALSITGKDYILLHDLVPKGYPAVISPGLGYILVPSGGKPNSAFSNVKVRQALEYAIDKQKICDTVFYGNTLARYQEALPRTTAYIKDFAGRQYDPAKAKALLAEAGFPTGFKTHLYCGSHLAGSDTAAVQAYMKAVGIDADLQLVNPAKWVEMETNGWEEGVMQSPQGLTPDFGYDLERYWVKPAAPNWQRGIYWDTVWRPAELEVMINKYLVMPAGTPDQIAAGQNINKYMWEQVMNVPVWEHKACLVLQPFVHDSHYNEMVSGWNFKTVWFSGK